MADPAEIVEILKLLVEYYNAHPTEQKSRLYIDALLDIPAFALSQAAMRHIKESPYFPRISELRRQAERIIAESGSNGDPVAYYWQAMDALNASFRGEVSEFELYKRFGRILIQAVLPQESLQEHLRSRGTARVDECPACHGSGVDPADPARLRDCPDCRGNGYFRIPLLPGAAGAVESLFLSGPVGESETNAVQ